MSSIVAREGFPFIAGSLTAACLLFLLSAFAPGGTGTAVRALALACFIFGLFCLYFFRNPERRVRLDPRAILAPADGTVIDIREIQEPYFMHASTLRISIFMSVFNVHVNRAPVSGSIAFTRYNPGKFISAFKEKASEDNESLLVGIRCSDQPARVAVKFIAGLIARRIVFYNKENDIVRQGDRINLIRFGSRVDMFCPADARITIARGDKVTAGKTILAFFKDA